MTIDDSKHLQEALAEVAELRQRNSRITADCVELQRKIEGLRAEVDYLNERIETERNARDEAQKACKHWEDETLRLTKELAEAMEVNKVHAEYESLLVEEIESMIELAYAHGWRTTRAEKGAELRSKLDALTRASASTQPVERGTCLTCISRDDDVCLKKEIEVLPKDTCECYTAKSPTSQPVEQEKAREWPCEHINVSPEDDSCKKHWRFGGILIPDNWEFCQICGAVRPQAPADSEGMTLTRASAPTQPSTAGERNETSLQILHSCGLYPPHYETLEKAALGVRRIIQHLRDALADPPPDVQELVLHKLGLDKPAAEQEKARECCKWTENENGAFETDCGHTFEFNYDGPTKNGCVFCCYCGKPLFECTPLSSPADSGKESK